MAGPKRPSVDPTVPIPDPLDPDASIVEDPSPAEDGGVGQHPIHDSDVDDMMPEDFEELIDPAAREQQPEMLPPADDDDDAA